MSPKVRSFETLFLIIPVVTLAQITSVSDDLGIYHLNASLYKSTVQERKHKIII